MQGLGRRGYDGWGRQVRQACTGEATGLDRQDTAASRAPGVRVEGGVGRTPAHYDYAGIAISMHMHTVLHHYRYGKCILLLLMER